MVYEATHGVVDTCDLHLFNYFLAFNNHLSFILTYSYMLFGYVTFYSSYYGTYSFIINRISEHICLCKINQSSDNIR